MTTKTKRERCIACGRRAPISALCVETIHGRAFYIHARCRHGSEKVGAEQTTLPLAAEAPSAPAREQTEERGARVS
jgi:hypothetical protein